MKSVLCDSSSLISLGDSCLDGVLYFLHEKFQLQFVIPEEVEHELVTRPLQNGLIQYYFSARKMKRAMADNVIVKTPSGDSRLTHDILEAANHLFFIRGKPLSLLHAGEAGMLAMAEEMGISEVLIDERTTRMIIEAPFRLKEHLEKEFGITVMVHKGNLDKLIERVGKMQVIRSSELVVLAYERGYFNRFSDPKETLEAALYKVKFSGCSIGLEEIRNFIQSV